MKKVPVTLIVEMEIEVLDDFDAHDVEFHLNDSSHCLDNEINDLAKQTAEATLGPNGAGGACFCERAHGFFGHRKDEIVKRLEKS